MFKINKIITSTLTILLLNCNFLYSSEGKENQAPDRTLISMLLHWMDVKMNTSISEVAFRQHWIKEGLNLRFGDDRETALYYATSRDNVEIVKLLLEAGANPSQTTDQGFTLLHMAAYNGLVEILQLLLDAGANPNSQTTDQGFTPLYMAADRGNVKIVEILASYPIIDLEVEEFRKGVRPLHHVASRGNVEIVKTLVDAGAQVNARVTKDQLTPLHYASFNGYDEVVKILVSDPRIDLEMGDIDGETALHKAVDQGFVETVKLLLKAGAQVNAQTTTGGCTPLHWAVFKDNYEIAEILLNAGAQLNVKAKEGCSLIPYELAIRKGYTKIAQLLLTYDIRKDKKTLSNMTEEFLDTVVDPIHEFTNTKSSLEVPEDEEI